MDNPDNHDDPRRRRPPPFPAELLKRPLPKAFDSWASPVLDGVLEGIIRPPGEIVFH